jgi:glycosyltransferase involved in cell wall biosynthesis
LIDTTGPGGAETIFTDLVCGTDPARFRSVPVLTGKGWLHDTLRARGAEVRLLPARARAPGAVADLARLFRAERADLVHAHLLGSAVYGTMAGWLSGTPVLATFHGSADFPSGDRLASVRSAILRRTRHVTLVSESLRRFFLARTRMAPERTSVIHNGVDLVRFHPGRSASLRAKLGIAADAVVIGALGNVRPAKAYDVLVRAAARLPAELPPWRVVIVGEGTPAALEELERQSQGLGIGDSVWFAGFREDPAEVLRNFDVFVLSSRSEGFSLATVQALATGLPVVATRSGGPEEILNGSEAGVLVPPDDPDALGGALAGLVADAGLRRQLGVRGPSWVRGRFDLEAMIAAYERLYDAL